MKLFKTVLLAAFAASVAAAIFVYSGVFNVAADVPHSVLVYWLMEAVRDRSISVRTEEIQVPTLDDPKLVAEGAEHYAAMCIDCHLAPGVKQSELREGLYPQPPNLTEHIHASPAEMFWVIKHGIKMSAMPAWGKTHDDQSIWGLVAFLRKLPELTPERYHGSTRVVKPITITTATIMTDAVSTEPRTIATPTTTKAMLARTDRATSNAESTASGIH